VELRQSLEKLNLDLDFATEHVAIVLTWLWNSW
jgi:hypothetical protein